MISFPNSCRVQQRHYVYVFQALLLLTLAASAQARTWHVTPDGTGDAPTIQAAMDSSAANDTVLVAAGTYTWSSEGATAPSMVRMKADVILRGEAGAPATLLDAERRGRVLQCTDVAGAHLEGLSIVHGSTDYEGGGILVEGNSKLTISNCIVRDNQAGCGAGGILCGAGTLIWNCEVLDNSAGCISGWGGGISCTGTRIVGCTIRGNGAGGQHGEGGGVFMSHSTLRDCRIEGNVAVGTLTTSGGGVETAFEDSVLACTFVGNSAGDGSALSFTSGTVQDCRFTRNEAGRSTVIGSGTMTRCTLVGNTASSDGTVLLISGTVTSTIVASNQAAACGGDADYSCNDLHGNSLGDGICGTDVGGNFSADPQFCAADPSMSLNFTLQQDSPCAPGNHPDGATCGLIGAAVVGCGTVSVTPANWSRLKSLYR